MWKIENIVSSYKSSKFQSVIFDDYAEKARLKIIWGLLEWQWQIPWIHAMVKATNIEELHKKIGSLKYEQ
jgi:hypothetical protein